MADKEVGPGLLVNHSPEELRHHLGLTGPDPSPSLPKAQQFLIITGLLEQWAWHYGSSSLCGTEWGCKHVNIIKLCGFWHCECAVLEALSFKSTQVLQQSLNMLLMVGVAHSP